MEVEVPMSDCMELSTNNDSVIHFSQTDDSFCVDSLLNELNNIKMKQSDKSKMFQLLSKLVKSSCAISLQLIEEDNGISPKYAVNATRDFVCNKLETFQSQYKRRKTFLSDPNYVDPCEKAVGTRVEMVLDKLTNQERPYLIQSSLQQISIIRTLEVFFACKENREIYFRHQEQHTCDANTSFGCFRCGKIYKNSKFFQENPNALQLQFATDEFDPCDSLGSKSNLHKMHAVYMIIRNLPNTYLSRLENIFLICLCNSDDLKTKSTDFNNIVELIVSEVKYLEDKGITLNDGTNIKGTIAYISADNMGFNLAFSLGGHSSSYYCRICELPRGVCQEITVEIPSKLRSNKKYERHLQTIECCEGKLDLKETCGVIRYCKFNDLSYFNIFENYSVDIMHDLTEGVIPLVLKELFQFCVGSHICKLDDLKKLCAFYSYPKEFRNNKPSLINMTRQHLGQNSSQMKCLLLNLPFILYQFHTNTEFKKVWVCMQQLIQIFQIVHSTRLTDKILLELKSLIPAFLGNIKLHFAISLTPKLHYMLHYLTVIEKMGPIALMSMIRLEAKHKFFKVAAKRTNNFINISKSLAISHQEDMCRKGNNFRDICSFTNRKKSNEAWKKDMKIKKSSEVFEIGRMTFNGQIFEREKAFSHQSTLYMIFTILEIDSEINLVAKKLVYLGIDDFSQSVKVEHSEFSIDQLNIIKFNDVKYKKCYPLKCLDENDFIIIDDMELLYEI